MTDVTPRFKTGLKHRNKTKREAKALRKFREKVVKRSGGWCETSTPDCPRGPHQAVHVHHVCPADRDRGVHDPDRALHMCAAGHAWIHANPKQSYELGYLLRDDGANKRII